LKNPSDEKFRLVKKTNAALKAKLFSLEGGIADLILALGYVDVSNLI
jgi:hypothetical protein